jgi:hypothetical protein
MHHEPRRHAVAGSPVAASRDREHLVAQLGVHYFVGVQVKHPAMAKRALVERVVALAGEVIRWSGA